VIQARLTINNFGEVSATGVSASIQINAGSSLLIPLGGVTPAGPITIPGGGTATTFVWSFSATGVGVVSFTATADGTDTGTQTRASAWSTSGLTLGAPGTLACTLTASRARPNVGDDVDVHLVVSCGGTVGVNLTSIAFELGGAGDNGMIIAGPTPSGIVFMNPGDAQDIVWTCRLAKPGDVTFRATVAGVDSGVGAAISVTSTSAVSVQYAAAETLTRGKVRIVPNALTATAPEIIIFMRGDDGGTAHVSIYDEVGRMIHTGDLSLGGDGLGVLRFDGHNDAGQRLGPGGYWVVGSGGGVRDKKPFMVMP